MEIGLILTLLIVLRPMLLGLGCMLTMLLAW
jgi:hypothetical protein